LRGRTLKGAPLAQLPSGVDIPPLRLGAKGADDVGVRGYVARTAGICGDFSRPLLSRALRSSIDLSGIACTLDAFRLLEPLEEDHRLESICERHGVVLEGVHDALCDALATADLLRRLLDDGIAPETVELDHEAFLRIRARGDTRPATERQIRRVFGLARPAGLLLSSGGVDRDQVIALVQQVAGTDDVDSLTREQVQDVYDALDRLRAAQPQPDQRAA
jgi:hypothetical protein